MKHAKRPKRKQTRDKTRCTMPQERRKRSGLYSNTPPKRLPGWFARLINYLY